jgi:exonuclease III
MKILSYNINRSTQEKIDKIMQFNADVFILPEVACPSQVKVPEGYRMEWMGNYDFKGLGVIWKSGMKAEVPQWYNPCHQYFLPIIIDNKLIMAAWPTRTDDNAPKDYPQIAMETLQEYAPYLKEFPTVISGDMNCYKGQAG